MPFDGKDAESIAAAIEAGRYSMAPQVAALGVAKGVWGSAEGSSARSPSGRTVSVGLAGHRPRQSPLALMQKGL